MAALPPSRVSKFIETFRSSPWLAIRLALGYLWRRVGRALGLKRSALASPSAQQTIAASFHGLSREELFSTSAMQAKLQQAKSDEYHTHQLTLVQDEIEECMKQEFGADNHYTKAYRREEALYWYPALAWIDQLTRVRRVADIGSAYGTLLLYASKQHKVEHLLAVDAYNYMAQVLIQRHRIEKIKIDIERQDLEAGERFDLVLFTEVLEHLNFYPASTLKKLHALLRDDGFLIITTPDAQEWGRVLDHYPALAKIPSFSGQTTTWFDGHVWQYTHEEAIAVMEEAGFKIVDWGYSKGVGARHLCYLLQRA